MKKTQLYILALVLAAIGLAGFFYKWKVLGFPVTAEAGTEVWEVQARVEYRARSGPNSVVLQIPDQPMGYSIPASKENFIARGFGLSKEDTKAGREARWEARRMEGTQALYYRARVFRETVANAQAEEKEPGLPKAEVFEEPFATARQALLDEVYKVSTGSASFASALIREINKKEPRSEVDLLLEDNDRREDRARLVVSLLKQRQIATRIIWGLPLNEPRDVVDIIPFIQVFDRDQKLWRTLDAKNGQEDWPDDYLLWTRSQKPLVAVEGVKHPIVEFSVHRGMVDALETAVTRLEEANKNYTAYSLMSLPLDRQEVYRILLMVPVGAFIMLLLRNLVGLKSFGTFMPVLVAISFRWTGLVSGIILFLTVVSMGLLVRFYLERLRLLLVPRLTAVLIVVVLLMALVSIISNRLGIEVGLSVALFPMIIMTMTIERISIAWEERGASFAIKEAIGSLLVACLAYVVMSWSQLEHLVFVFPELLLILLAITLVIGRYSGYRLTELLRFRALARDTSANAGITNSAANQPKKADTNERKDGV